MGDFTIKFKSTDGLYRDAFLPSCAGLEDTEIVWNEAPGENLNHGMDYFYTQWQGYQVPLTTIWNNAFARSCTRGEYDDLGDLAQALIAEGAIDNTTMKEIYALPLLEDANTCIVLMGYGNQNYLGFYEVHYTLQKRVKTNQTYSYSSINGDMLVGISEPELDYGFFGGTMVRGGSQYYVFGMAVYHSEDNYIELFGWSNSYNGMINVVNGIPDGEKMSPEFGKPGKRKGGYNPDHRRKGSFDDSSDTISLTPFPIYDPCDAQFVKLWVMDATDLAHISDALFPTYDLSQLDILGTWKEIAEMLLNNKRIDYILDLLIVPVEPPHATNKQHITCGGWVLSYFGNESTPQIHYVDGKLVQSSFTEVDCGSVEIPEYWANFLDFSGTKIKLFLPYIGYVDIEPEYVIGGEISVKYRFNAFDGSFMAYVTSTSGHSELSESLIGQFAGVAAVHIPLQSQDYTQKISGLISSMGSVAAGVASGNPASAIGAASNLSNTIMSKPGSAHANGYNASSSFLSHKKPYLIIERQSSQFSEKYPEEVGLPLYMSDRLGNFTGLTKCKSAHLDTIPCTIEGKERISQLLADGIIL